VGVQEYTQEKYGPVDKRKTQEKVLKFLCGQKGKGKPIKNTVCNCQTQSTQNRGRGKRVRQVAEGAVARDKTEGTERKLCL